MARIMDSLRRFFTLEEESFSVEAPESESIEPKGKDYPASRPRQAVPPPAPAQAGAALQRHARGNVVSFPQPRKQEIVVLEPASFADAREIAESLRVKKCILLNMRKTDKELARRIVDFLSGISYAMEGNQQKVADNIFLFVPGHMEIVIADHQDPSAAKGGGGGGGGAEELLASGDSL